LGWYFVFGEGWELVESDERGKKTVLVSVENSGFYCSGVNRTAFCAEIVLNYM
jgi:hypothetical protein